MDAAQTLIRGERFPKPRPSHNGCAGFTLIELFFIIAIIALLAALLLPALSRGKAKSIRIACLGREKQIAIALHMYAGDYKDRLPDNQRAGGGVSWPWDMSWNVGTNLEASGTKWLVWYCPGSRFSDRDNSRLWNYSPGDYRVLGYAMTFRNTSTLAKTNCIPAIVPQDWIGPSYVPPPLPSVRVLLADLTISPPGQNNEANRAANTYVNIRGGYPKRFRTSHMEGAMPLGGNVAMLDGHVEWRFFWQMRVRTVGSASPVFWW